MAERYEAAYDERVASALDAATAPLEPHEINSAAAE